MSSSDAEIDPLAQIRVEAGNPSPEHAAAVIAVVAGMMRDGGVVEAETGVDGWTRSVRTLRSSMSGAVAKAQAPPPVLRSHTAAASARRASAGGSPEKRTTAL
jgi:hypothetical protein